MAHRLGLKVVVEGIETAAQLALMRAAGCDYAQGYYLGKPAGIEALEAMARQGRGRSHKFRRKKRRRPPSRLLTRLVYYIPVLASLAALPASVVAPAELWSFASPVTGALALPVLVFIALVLPAGRATALGEVGSFASPTFGGTTPGLTLPVAFLIFGVPVLAALAEVWSLASPVGVVWAWAAAMLAAAAMAIRAWARMDVRIEFSW
jgi:hypothetical protein